MTTHSQDPLQALRRAQSDGTPSVVCTVVATRGSTPRKPGAKMLVTQAAIAGTLGGGRIEHEAIAYAHKLLDGGDPHCHTFALTHDLGMCCGGEMTLFFEPYPAPNHLLVFGCGHVGQALINACGALDFRITAIDDLEENLALLPNDMTRVCSFDRDALAPLPDNAFVIIATRDHGLDQKLLEYWVTRPTRFLGCIGSKRKALMQRERLLAKGFSKPQVDHVTCPVGVSIAAQTPAEIAVSIAGQLIDVLRTPHQATTSTKIQTISNKP